VIVFFARGKKLTFHAAIDWSCPKYKAVAGAERNLDKSVQFQLILCKARSNTWHSPEHLVIMYLVDLTIDQRDGLQKMETRQGGAGAAQRNYVM
jgi:hypothetical protein